MKTHIAAGTRGKRTIFGGFIATLMLVAFAPAANATLLDLQLLEPDVTSSFITINYSSATNVFTADGFAVSVDFGAGPQQQISNGLFSLEAIIDETGALQSGSITVGGTVGPFNSGLLIAGDLIEFGFMEGGGNVFEFRFTPTSGDLLPLYGVFDGGVIMGGVGFNGDWTSDFSANGVVTDTAPVPVPAALWLFASGLLAFGGMRRRRQG